MLRVAVPRFWWNPATAWLVVLATIFVTEYVVMLVLPWVLAKHSSRWVEATVDAVALVTVLSPIIWWTVVRPLQEVISLRTRFLTELFARIEADRRQTAYELHDGIGQSLSMLVSGLRSSQATTQDAAQSQRDQRLFDLAKRTLDDVKRLAMGLRPSMLDDLGLAPALDRLVADIQANHQIELTLDTGKLGATRLGPAVETTVFRIIQEGLANVVAHAHAKSASVAVRVSDDRIAIEIQDDGQGMSDQITPTTGRLGLLGMRERAALVGGSFDIQSSPGHGTRLIATIPLIC